uniref:MIP18 family-like domain-containing protein n=1 Tax=Chenopodium quinoa TaxID=63459 RepID=A0A803L6S5_CHEQI
MSASPTSLAACRQPEAPPTTIDQHLPFLRSPLTNSSRQYFKANLLSGVSGCGGEVGGMRVWFISPNPDPNSSPSLYTFDNCLESRGVVGRDIRDPEHPYSLEQLSVLTEDSITVDDNLARILITFTPTVQHCSMATVIGLCLRVKLKHYFPPHYKVDIKVSPGSHADEGSVNKQLNDKERIAAALENPNLRHLVDECLSSNEVINFN